MWASAYIGGGGDLAPILDIGDLFAARQVRRYLDYVADDPGALLPALRLALGSNVRSHLVALTLWWLRSWSTPTAESWMLVKAQLSGDYWRHGVVYRILRENTAMFQLAYDDGWFEPLLSGDRQLDPARPRDLDCERSASHERRGGRTDLPHRGH